jgi:aspartate/methionine/tyrosine aminotransferase
MLDCLQAMFSRRTPPSHASNRLSRALEEVRSSGAGLIDLTESNPTRCGFTYDTNAIGAALAGSAAAPYEPHPQGMAVARAAIAASYADRGIAVDPDFLVLCSGTSEGYAHLFTLLAEAGDDILVPAPGYPLLEVLTGLGGLRLVHYRQVYREEAGWRIDLDSIEAAVGERSRAIVVVSPNNPTGSFLKRRELEAIASLCAARGIALIVDEVFSDYASGSDPDRVAAAAEHNRCLTFVLNGLSKISGLPQMKLAWVYLNGPAGIRAEARDRLSFVADAYLSVGTPVQHAAPALLAERRTVAPQILSRVESNFEALRAMAERGACRLLSREGGWYAVLRLPDRCNDEHVSLDLLRHDGVLAHPGYLYDFPPAGAHLVLSLLLPRDQFEEGARRILARVEAASAGPG